MPVFYYDQTCPFCCRCVEHWKHSTCGFVDFRPLQESPYGLDRIVFVAQNGTRFEGARAVIEMFAYDPKKRLLRWVYFHIPFVDYLFEWVYKKISSCRECSEKFGWVFYKGEKK